MMKKWLFVLCLPLLLIGVGACSDDESKLTGKWQLQRYEYDNGEVEQVDYVFYNFQKNSFSIIINEGGFFGTYSLQDDKISITLLPDYSGDIYDKYLGWENNQRIFHIDELSSSRLRLSYGNVTLVFRKY